MAQTPRESSPIVGVREAMAILDRDKNTVIRWANNGVLTIVDKLPGKNGAILLRRRQVLKLAERLHAEAEAKAAKEQAS